MTSCNGRNTIPFTSTCDLYDQYLDQARVPSITWRHYGAVMEFCGHVVTVKCFEDNSRIKELVEATDTDRSGQVLVVDGGGSHRCALLGDQLAECAVQQRWAGIIVYGCVRDVALLNAMPLGIVALGNIPRKSTRRGQGLVNLPIRLGDVECRPGDVVFCDHDGVLILGPEHFQATDPRS